MKASKRKTPVAKILLVVSLIVIVVAAGGYITWFNWPADKPLPIAGVVGHQGQNPPSDAPNVSTKPLPKNALDEYKVAPDRPRAIYIDKIGVAARLLPMGVNSDNSMQVPGNVNDAGWYTGSAEPGQPGAVVVDGHASETGTHYGLFGNLLSLRDGDIITVERGDGQKFDYSIVHTEVDPLAGLDMSKALVPYGNATQGLNLITCTGKWTKDGSTLDHRLLVFATPVSS